MPKKQDLVFLHVNNYSDTKRLKYEVKSHISGTYRRQQKNKDVKRPPVPPVPRKHVVVLAQPDLEVELVVQQSPQKRQRYEPQEESPTDAAVLIWQKSRLSIQSLCFAGTRVDPFGLYPIEASSYVKEALDFYDNVYVHTQEPIFAISFSDNPHREWVLPTAMSNVETCHAAVALALNLRQLWSMRTDPAITAQIALQRRLTIAQLKSRLSRPDFYASDSILISVVILASLDLLTGDPVSFFHHWRGLKILIESRGGLDNLGRQGKVKAALMEYDLCFMLLTKSSQTLHPAGPMAKDSYPTTPFPQTLLDLIGPLPWGFRQLALQQRLCIDVIKILHRAQIPVKFRKAVPIDVDLYEVASNLHHSPEPKDLERCICFAIVLWEHFTYSKERDPTMAFRAFRKALGEFLPDIRWTTPVERECVIWMWAMLVESWRFKNVFLKEGLDAQRAMTLLFPEMSIWRNLEVVLLRFFWTPDLQYMWAMSWEPYLHAPILPPLQMPVPTTRQQSLSPAPTSSSTATSATTPLQLPFPQSLTSAEARRAQMSQGASSLATPPETPPPSDSPVDAIQPRLSPRSSKSPEPGISSYVLVMR